VSKKVLLRWTFFLYDNQPFQCGVLGVVCALLDEPFFGFSDGGWFVLFIQASPDRWL
jgi:hypothetical protein